MAQAFHPVETHGLEASVAQHLGHLYYGNSQGTSDKQDTRRILLNILFNNTYMCFTCTWAYSWPSSLKTSSLFSPSFSFFPLLLFFPPFPLFFGILVDQNLVSFSCKTSNCLFETQILLVASPKSEHKMQDGTSLNLWILGVKYLA